MKGKNQHVTKRADGKWQVKGEGRVALPLLRRLRAKL